MGGCVTPCIPLVTNMRMVIKKGSPYDKSSKEILTSSSSSRPSAALSARRLLLVGLSSSSSLSSVEITNSKILNFNRYG